MATKKMLLLHQILGGAALSVRGWVVPMSVEGRGAKHAGNCLSYFKFVQLSDRNICGISITSRLRLRVVFAELAEFTSMLVD